MLVTGGSYHIDQLNSLLVSMFNSRAATEVPHSGGA